MEQKFTDMIQNFINSECNNYSLINILEIHEREVGSIKKHTNKHTNIMFDSYSVPVYDNFGDEHFDTVLDIKYTNNNNTLLKIVYIKDYNSDTFYFSFVEVEDIIVMISWWDKYSITLKINDERYTFKLESDNNVKDKFMSKIPEIVQQLKNLNDVVEGRNVC